MSREEAAAKILVRQTGDDPWDFGAPDKDVYLIDTREILAAADAHDLAHGIHRIKSDWATLGRVSDALYEHRPDALTCYDHDEPGKWCCICGEHEINEIWRDHVARAVLAAAVQEERS